MVPQFDFLKRLQFENLFSFQMYSEWEKFNCKSYLEDLDEMIPQRDFLTNVHFKDLFRFLVSSQWIKI